jgi:hypothetical protein
MVSTHAGIADAYSARPAPHRGGSTCTYLYKAKAACSPHVIQLVYFPTFSTANMRWAIIMYSTYI